ncbi:MAG: GNAT family N-acetyltransferase [Candidatus Calescibacterium sp.]|nr:GNAT family N-acetyltransferase [Candidatus Calescibacterium sp.]MDW8133009.1 GNAT family N-acetyltransferase [Candidatus Calescibacterium sp.]
MEDSQDFLKVQEEMVELYQKAYEEMDDYYYKNSKDVFNYIEWLYNHNRDSALIILAKKDNQIIGFIAGDTHYYDKDSSNYVMNIHELVVKKEFRGLGIATQLIYEFINRSKQKNKEKDKKVNGVILWVGKNNQKALRLYTNLGFSVQYKTNKWIKMRMNIL